MTLSSESLLLLPNPDIPAASLSAMQMRRTALPRCSNTSANPGATTSSAQSSRNLALYTSLNIARDRFRGS